MPDRCCLCRPYLRSKIPIGNTDRRPACDHQVTFTAMSGCEVWVPHRTPNKLINTFHLTMHVSCQCSVASFVRTFSNSKIKQSAKWFASGRDLRLWTLSVALYPLSCSRNSRTRSVSMGWDSVVGELSGLARKVPSQIVPNCLSLFHDYNSQKGQAAGRRLIAIRPAWTEFDQFFLSADRVQLGHSGAFSQLKSRSLPRTFGKFDLMQILLRVEPGGY